MRFLILLLIASVCFAGNGYQNVGDNQVMVGASAGSDGSSGLVPAPLAGQESECLSGAGTYLPCDSGGGITSLNGLAGATQTFATGTAGTDFGIVSSGTTHTFNLPTATAAHRGALSSADWSTFNGKQSSGAYITGLDQDVVASGPGVAHAVAPNSSYKRYVNFVTGDDATGTGSDLRPWKTLQKACTAVTGLATINTPFVLYLSGGNNDQDAAPITCPPNINIVSDYTIGLSQGLTITGGFLNDTVSATNIIFSTFTWIRNDTTQLSLTFTNCAASGLVDFEQQGAGVSGSFFAINGGGLTGGATIEAFQSNILSRAVYGNLTFKDAGNGAFATITGADIFSATVDVSGGFYLELAGDIADAGYSVVGHTTGSGTPILVSDSGSLPAPGSITGAYSLSFTSYADYTAYAPSLSSAWSTVPTTVKEALDSVRILSQSAAGSQPACDVSHRGLEWLVEAGAGVADVYQICQKTALDTYVWTTH